MKAIKTLVLLLALGLSVYGQAVNVTANKIKGSATAPSGACSAQQAQLTTAGVFWVCGSGSWVSSGGGTTINSTNGQVPYRVNSTTFGDSAFSSNALNSTYLSATSGASGAGVTVAVAGGGTNESLILQPKGTGGQVFLGGRAELRDHSTPFNDTNVAFSVSSNAKTWLFNLYNGATLASGLNRTTYNFQVNAAGQYSLGSTLDSPDIAWSRLSAGVARFGNGSSGAGQLLIGTSTDTADAQLSVYSQSTTRPSLKLRALSGTAAGQNVLESYDASNNLTFQVKAFGQLQIDNGGVGVRLYSSTYGQFGTYTNHHFGFFTNNQSFGFGLRNDATTVTLRSDGALAFVSTTDALTGTPDTYLVRDAANWLAQRNGTNAQTFSVYGTYTNSSNFRQTYIQTDATGEGYLYTYGLGTGASAGALNLGTVNIKRWSISTSGHFLAGTDNTYDIGANGATRPRHLNLAGNIELGGNLNLASNNIVNWTSRSQISSTSNGVLLVTNQTSTDFSRLQFGGTSVSFPAIGRDGAGIKIVGADGTSVSWIKVPGVTVANLPAAATAGAGARSFVTDALTPVFGSAVTGGGAVAVPVYSDGTNWIVG